MSRRTNAERAALCQAAVRELSRRWPVLLAHKPLKIGIHHDMIQAGADPATVRLALGWVARHPRYVKNLANGHQRCDLEGNPVGAATDEQRAKARALMDRRAGVAAQVPVPTNPPEEPPLVPEVAQQTEPVPVVPVAGKRATLSLRRAG